MVGGGKYKILKNVFYCLFTFEVTISLQNFKIYNAKVIGIKIAFITDL